MRTAKGAGCPSQAEGVVSVLLSAVKPLGLEQPEQNERKQCEQEHGPSGRRSHCGLRPFLHEVTMPQNWDVLAALLMAGLILLAVGVMKLNASIGA